MKEDEIKLFRERAAYLEALLREQAIARKNLLDLSVLGGTRIVQIHVRDHSSFDTTKIAEIPLSVVGETVQAWLKSRLAEMDRKIESL